MGHLHPPLSALQLLSRTLSLYRRDFIKFAGLSIIGPVAICVFRQSCGVGAVALVPLDSSRAALPLLAVLAGIMIAFAGATISSAATVQAVAAAGRSAKVSVAAGYRALIGRFWRVLGIVFMVFIRAFPLSVLATLPSAILVALAAALGYNSRVQAGIIGYVCGSVALISAIFTSIWVCAPYAVAVQACAVEGIGSRLALKRSKTLTAGDRYRITTIHFAFLMLVLAGDFICGAPALLLASHGAAFRIAGAVAGFIALALTAPVATIAMSLVYYERARQP